MRRDFAIFHSEVHPADVDSAATNLEDNRVPPVRRLLRDGFFHERVGVAAGDESAE